MRKLACLTAVLAVGLVAGSATGAGFHAGSAVAACRSGYVTAHLSWGVRCLAPGELCRIGSRQYARYGFACLPTGYLRRIAKPATPPQAQTQTQTQPTVTVNTATLPVTTLPMRPLTPATG